MLLLITALFIQMLDTTVVTYVQAVCCESCYIRWSYRLWLFVHL